MGSPFFLFFFMIQFRDLWLVSAAMLFTRTFLPPRSTVPSKLGCAHGKIPSLLMRSVAGKHIRPQQSRSQKTGNEQNYDAEYLRYQRGANIFGAYVKGKLISHMIPKNTYSIMEFGCSAGHILANVSLPGKESVSKVCVEINPTARLYALKSFPHFHEIVERVGGMSDPHWRASFIYSTSVLEHCDCPICELRKLRAVLATGGALLIGVSNDGINWQLAPNPGDRNHHIYTWNRLLLANMVQMAGFRVCGAVAHHTAWPHTDVQQYMREGSREFCTHSRREGKKINAMYQWLVATDWEAGSADRCVELRQKLDVIDRCEY